MQDLDSIVQEALAAFAGTDDPPALEQAKARYLGKSGVLTGGLKGLGRLPAAERPALGGEFKGLRQLFTAGQVSVVTLDEESSRSRGSKVDRVLKIGTQQIEPEDVEMLSGLLGLSDVQTGALPYLRRRLGPAWIDRLLSDAPDEELAAMVEDERIASSTLGAIQRKFEFFRRLGFLVPGAGDDAVDDIFHRLNQGTSVVLEFGRYGNTLAAYILVANYLTRRVHERYVRKKNEAVGKKADEPRPLEIVIEEAHKFLDPAIAGHTIFGSIARELRNTTSRC